jgi:hypothetical protein
MAPAIKREYFLVLTVFRTSVIGVRPSFYPMWLDNAIVIPLVIPKPVYKSMPLSWLQNCLPVSLPLSLHHFLRPLCYGFQVKYIKTPEHLLAGADSFAVEHRKAQELIKWMNAYAKKNNHKFESKLTGYSMQTIKFGSFEMIFWSGDWSAARNIIQKASKQLRAKVIESGYHEKRGLLSAMFGGGSEYGKVYSNGSLVGKIEINKKGGRWAATAESYI